MSGCHGTGTARRTSGAASGGGYSWRLRSGWTSPAIDLWLCEVRRRGSLKASERGLTSAALTRDFLQLLRRQRESRGSEWTSYAALRALAKDADLVLETNGIRLQDDGVPSWVGNRVPAVGMSGQVNTTAVR